MLKFLRLHIWFKRRNIALMQWQLHLRWHSNIELIVCTCSTEYKTPHAHFHTVASNVLISEVIMGHPVTIVKQKLLWLKSCDMEKRKMQTVRLTVKIGLNVKLSHTVMLKPSHSCMFNQSSQNYLQRSYSVFMYYSPHLKWNLFFGSMCALCARTPTCCSKAPNKAQAEVGHNVSWPGSAGKFSLRWKDQTRWGEEKRIFCRLFLLQLLLPYHTIGPPYHGRTGNVQRTPTYAILPYSVFMGSIDSD